VVITMRKNWNKNANEQ